MTREEMLRAVGRGYTHEGHTHKLVDVDLCVAMVEELLAAQAQATADNSAVDTTCDTIECPDCGAEFSVGCECPICKGHWLRHKQHQ